ncbi:MAG: hypothetical protein JRG82_18290 [Deltaproteobacteria bacterium]|nr:hypothetical protein [Deltaproteobacteria bacterium]
MGTRERMAAVAAVVFAIATLLTASNAEAAFDGCAVIESASSEYMAYLGSTTRPAQIPGFPAEIRVDPTVCGAQTESAAADFRDSTSPSDCDNAAIPCTPLEPSAFSLNFVFTPANGPSNAVVLTEDCTAIDTSTCGGVPVHCLDSAASEGKIRIFEEPHPRVEGATLRVLRYVFPDTTGLAGSACFGGVNSGGVCTTDAECGTGTCTAVPLTGPMTVAATLGNVPCGLASQSCATFGGAMVSCADDLFRNDNTCFRDALAVDPQTINVTALPSPVELADVCPQDADPSAQTCVGSTNAGRSCTDDTDCPDGTCGICRAPSGVRPIVTLTQDKRGNLMGVTSARGNLVVIDERAFPWLTRGAIEIGTPSGPKRLAPARDEARGPNYALVHPFYQAISDPNGSGESFATLDAELIIRRAVRRSCVEDESRSCSFTTADCTCTVDHLGDLPDPLPATAGGAGPILGECPLDAAGVPICRLLANVTQDAVTGSDESSDAFAVPVNECIAQVQPGGAELSNEDGNADVVLTLYDRRTGLLQQLGSGESGPVARALTQIVDEPPFSFSTDAAEGGVVAFLEPEIGECDFSEEGAGMSCDRKPNGLLLDHILRVFRLREQGSVVPDELSPSGEGGMVSAQPDLNVNGAALVVSNGQVFFRAPAESPERAVELVSADEGGDGGDASSSEPSVSPDGGHVAFTTIASDLGAISDGESPADPIVALKNRATGQLRIVSAADRSSCEDSLVVATRSGSPSVSTNGRFVAFQSDSDVVLGEGESARAALGPRRTATPRSPRSRPTAASSSSRAGPRT